MKIFCHQDAVCDADTRQLFLFVVCLGCEMRFDSNASALICVPGGNQTLIITVYSVTEMLMYSWELGDVVVHHLPKARGIENRRRQCRGPSSSQDQGGRKQEKAVLNLTLLMEIIEQSLEMRI
jgi:hypothetical protein